MTKLNALRMSEAEVRATPKDISTDKGRKAIAALAHKVARTKTFVDIALQRMAERAELLDRLLTCVPGPDSKGYKLAEIMKIAEEWQNIR